MAGMRLRHRLWLPGSLELVPTCSQRAPCCISSAPDHDLLASPFGQLPIYGAGAAPGPAPPGAPGRCTTASSLWLALHWTAFPSSLSALLPPTAMLPADGSGQPLSSNRWPRTFQPCIAAMLTSFRKHPEAVTYREPGARPTQNETLHASASPAPPTVLGSCPHCSLGCLDKMGLPCQLTASLCSPCSIDA